MQHMVESFVNAGMFQCQNILRLFYNTDFGSVTIAVAANGAGVGFGDITAGGTQGYFLLER